jgi:DNA polymerase/3'-5' exonuclease PolX
LSSGKKIPLAEAERLAEKYLEALSPYCLRIEAAGSVRRRKPEVGDLELVAIPRPVLDLFGQPSGDHCLNGVDWAGQFSGQAVKDGPKYKQIIMPEITLDLFIVTPPAQWGVIFLLRTGPDTFSQKLLSRRQDRGLLPSWMRSEDGAIRGKGKIIETPEEEDVFRLAEFPFVEPKERR